MIARTIPFSDFQQGTGSTRGSKLFNEVQIMAAKKATGTQVTSEKSMKKTSTRTESTKKQSVTKKGEGKYDKQSRK